MRIRLGAMFRLQYSNGNVVGAALLPTIDSSVKFAEFMMELHLKAKQRAVFPTTNMFAV